MGVARNPLRDGAPPTGFTFEHHFRVFSREHGALEGESTKPSPCFIVHRVSGARPGPRCATFSIRSRDHFSRRRTGGRLRRSSRRCSPSIKDDLVERSSVTPRAALEQGNSHLLRSRRRGACVAPCEPGRLQSNRGRKWPSPHDVLSRTPLAGSTRFARFMSPKAADRVENPRSPSHGRDPLERTWARANGPVHRSDPKRVRMLEAPGVALPLPPSGWA
jgi:hypothetical protein